MRRAVAPLVLVLMLIVWYTIISIISLPECQSFGRCSNGRGCTFGWSLDNHSPYLHPTWFQVENSLVWFDSGLDSIFAILTVMCEIFRTMRTENCVEYFCNTYGKVTIVWNISAILTENLWNIFAILTEKWWNISALLTDWKLWQIFRQYLLTEATENYMKYFGQYIQFSIFAITSNTLIITVFQFRSYIVCIYLNPVMLCIFLHWCCEVSFSFTQTLYHFTSSWFFIHSWCY